MPCTAECCPPEAGCMAVLRAPGHPLSHRERSSGVEDLHSQAVTDEGSEFEYQSSQEDDPLEYDSSCQSSHGGSVVGDDDLSESQLDSSLETYAAFVRSISSSAGDLDQLIPQSEIRDSNLSSYEHIAGSLDCQLNFDCPESGYNGHAISADEMRGCNTLQCLARKRPGWKTAPDDQEFEKNGDFFLGGLSDYAPSRDLTWPTFFPVRHGCDTPPTDNHFWFSETANEVAMPFHPTCLEVFKRVSLLRNGSIDYDGLIDWWILEGDYDAFHAFPRDPAVDTSQWFQHSPGDEFLAANPCFIPGLPAIMASSDRSSDPVFNHNTGAFPGKFPTTFSGDPFSKLPQELKLMVLSYLGLIDIANIRLASRCFRQLSQGFFRSLILRDMPWLWEAWSSMEYSIWANTKASELKKRDKQHVERITEIEHALKVLAEEAHDSGDESINQNAVSALQRLADDERSKSIPLPTPAPLLDADKTDWYLLLTKMARTGTRLLGLRNRRRIWKDCEEILDRIDRYRDEGSIRPGERVDARAVAEIATERQREKNRRWLRYCEAGRPGEYRFEDWA